MSVHAAWRAVNQRGTRRMASGTGWRATVETIRANRRPRRAGSQGRGNLRLDEFRDRVVQRLLQLCRELRSEPVRREPEPDVVAGWRPALELDEQQRIREIRNPSGEASRDVARF